MKDSLVSGISKTARITVDTPRTIDFMGEDCRVYATPELVRDIEMTCRELILEHCEEGEDSVGTRVAIDHLAPTVLGMWAEITVSVSEVKGRAVSFEIKGRDAADDIVRGAHNRFVVDVAKTAERLKAKASKVE